MDGREIERGTYTLAQKFEAPFTCIFFCNEFGTFLWENKSVEITTSILGNRSLLGRNFFVHFSEN